MTIKMRYTTSSIQRKRDVLRWLVPAVTGVGAIFGGAVFLVTQEVEISIKMGFAVTTVATLACGGAILGATQIGGSGGNR